MILYICKRKEPPFKPFAQHDIEHGDTDAISDARQFRMCSMKYGTNCFFSSRLLLSARFGFTAASEEFDCNGVLKTVQKLTPYGNARLEFLNTMLIVYVGEYKLRITCNDVIVDHLRKHFQTIRIVNGKAVSISGGLVGQARSIIAQAEHTTQVVLRRIRDYIPYKIREGLDDG